MHSEGGKLIIGKVIMPLEQFLQELFEASANYSLPTALGKLRAYGGISSLLNSLAIDHRQITDIYKHHQQQSFPSACILPSNERTKKPSRKQPQLENILLYLITLSFFVKVLLYDNQLREELNIYSQVISFVFLIFIMAEKKSRAAPETIENIPQQAGEHKRFRVRRQGCEHHLRSQEMRQGDIALVEPDDNIKFDAIVLQIVPSSKEGQKENSFITINEEDVGTGRSKCRKSAVWKIEQGYQQDPFLLANSKVLGGSAWALVCLTAKASPSKRSSEVQVGGILKLSSVSRQVEHVIRVAVVLLVAYLSLVWISKQSMDPYEVFLQLVYLISCLTLYLSYASTSEFLTCLKKYLKQKFVGKGYRILNPKLLERLGEVDLVVIELDCLAQRKDLPTRIDLALLTKINELIDLKIVTPLSQRLLQDRFGGDVNPELNFAPSPTQDTLLKQTLEQLARSKFISINYGRFRQYYLEILRDLRYCMVYMSRSREAIGKYEGIITIKCSDIEAGLEERLQGEWIRVSHGESAETVFLDIMEKAKVYRRFQTSFYTILINNCLELLMLIGWALSGCLVDLNLNLLIVFFNRNRVKQFYEAVCAEGSGWQRGKIRALPLYIQINLIFLVYYIYMNWEISNSSNREFQLFLLLMTNRMFRVQALLREKYHPSVIYRLLWKSFIIFGLILLEAIVKWELGSSSDFISQSLDILLLPLILLLFSLYL